MRNWLAVGVVGVVSAMVSIVAAGCSSTAPVSLQDFCDQKAELECKYVQPACAELLSSAECVSNRTSTCLTDAENATSSGARVFNPNNISNCLNAISSAYGVLTATNPTLPYAQISGTPTDQSTVAYLCESVFQGDLISGATCSSNYDCASPFVCTPSNGGSKVNVCAPLTNVNDGDPCGGAGEVCPSGDACVENKKTLEYSCEPSGTVLVQQGGECTVSSASGADPTIAASNCDPTSAGLCDIYPVKGTKPLCQTSFTFGYGNDCQYFGGTSPR